MSLAAGEREAGSGDGTGAVISVAVCGGGGREVAERAGGAGLDLFIIGFWLRGCKHHDRREEGEEG